MSLSVRYVAQMHIGTKCRDCMSRGQVIEGGGDDWVVCWGGPNDARERTAKLRAVVDQAAREHNREGEQRAMLIALEG